MKYTNRLKMCIAADAVIFIWILVAYILFWNDKPISFGKYLMSLVLMVFICSAAEVIKDLGKCRIWHNIWKIPIWQILLFVILAGSAIALYFVLPENYYNMTLVLLVVALNMLALDIRYYRNARKYKMDELNSVNELALKYIGARPYIKRKLRPEIEENEQ